MKRSAPVKRTLFLAAGVAAFMALTPSLVYEGGGGQSCARCHEIRPTYESWTSSAHREVPCADCHGGLLTADLGFHAGNLRRLAAHWRGDVPARILLARAQDLDRVTQGCRKCHQQEYAAWRAGPHSATYADIFLDEEHNAKRLLMDDCLRCHGMHFQGAIDDLVEPVSTTGPWRLKVAELAEEPVMPCVACHEIHRHGEPRPVRDRSAPVITLGEPVMPPSLALFDRRIGEHISAKTMPVPAMFDSGRPVEMSPDERQALCYQCHAARARAEAGSGDDRTARGVHEGISCLACHAGHAMETRASCAGCHPRFSNCGMDLDKMNTLMRDPRSPFDIHTVQCKDCHPKQVPPRRNVRGAAGAD